MGRKKRDGGRQEFGWEGERTLADAEAEAGELSELPGGDADMRCVCGSEEFLLEAYMHVVDGRLRPDPVEVEALTCPQCSREFEAIQGEGGRILRGDFLGYADVGEED